MTDTMTLFAFAPVGVLAWIIDRLKHLHWKFSRTERRRRIIRRVKGK